jgi:hypothetical protein
MKDLIKQFTNRVVMHEEDRPTIFPQNSVNLKLVLSQPDARTTQLVPSKSLYTV